VKGSGTSDDACQNPENIQNRVSPVFFQNRALGQQYRVNRIKNPCKQERAVRSQATSVKLKMRIKTPVILMLAMIKITDSVL